MITRPGTNPMVTRADPHDVPVGATWCGDDMISVLYGRGDLQLLSASTRGIIEPVTVVHLQKEFSSVGGLSYRPDGKLLFVAGGHPENTALPTAGTPKVCGWRVLAGSPYVAAIEVSSQSAAPNRGVVDSASAAIQLSLAPDGSELVVLDSMGAMHLFRVPSLECRRCVREALSLCLS